MKKVLGLDLGTTSIGWAMVNQAEETDEQSSIIRAGVRVNPLTSDEKDCFEKGKAITTNADRTLKRGMRRNLQRYKLRRNALLDCLREFGWIDDNTVLSEDGNSTTLDTFRIRAKAAREEVSLQDLSRVLLMINKKRGYKSNRKADASEEGSLLDGIEVAKILDERKITPGQYSLELLEAGTKVLPDFYRSDLLAEFNAIWNFQREFYGDILTDEFKSQVLSAGRLGTSKVFLAKYGIYTADNKGKDKKITALKWRVSALCEALESERLAYVLSDLSGAISGSSGYLGAISDRSKEIYFAGKTVGEYQYEKLISDPGYSTRNEVFYRQDYIIEFNKIWECQKRYHPELTDERRKRLEEQIIFFQRRLKSQKGLISFCEFEKKDVKVVVDGKQLVKTRGCRVAPRSSLAFQEFKMLQVLNNVVVRSKNKDEKARPLTDEERHLLEQELRIKPKMKSSEALKLIGLGSRAYELNYQNLEGNDTLADFYEKFIEIVNASGNGDFDLKGMSYEKAYSVIYEVFSMLGFSTDILSFRTDLPKEQYEQQPLFKLWHLLYSYEGDNSNTGTDSLVAKIAELCSMPAEYAKLLINIRFKDDYASLSHKAIMKILPYLKDGNTYDVACLYAGYNHSDFKTKEEIENKVLKDRLDVLPKGALRNPVVEKIINQMINVVNAVADEYGKPDEIHIELARELKKNAKQRENASKEIADRTKANADIEKLLKTEFNLAYVSKTDILRYRLYEELKDNGYKTLYSNTYIPREDLFTKRVEIEHIIPQALLFDDSFSNKTLEISDVNRDKGARTANDYVKDTYGEEYYLQYKLRVDDLQSRGVISKEKCKKLLMKQSEIPEDFIERDLRNSQYIARKSREMLEEYVKVVMPTTGSVTLRLREDWGLVDVMKELNIPKYQKVGKVSSVERDGHMVNHIDDWTKRNDHRHHAMDALTIAFTRPSHIQYLNNLSSRNDPSSSIYGIMQKELEVKGGKLLFKSPMPNLRSEFKRELESVLVSIKAKNKVVTRNVNKTKTAGGVNKTVELTPRGPLHKETVYGKRLQYETYYIAVGSKLTVEEVRNVASKVEREALLRRLHQFEDNPKKAFTGKNAPDKNPIFLNSSCTRKIENKVKCVRMKEVFSIRKSIDPSLTLDKVMDGGVKKALEDRLEEFGGDQKKAFANLQQNPVYINGDTARAIKKVTIKENFDLCAIHDKRDKDGRIMLDADGNTIPTDYVNLRNNHHIAIYKDEQGNFQERVVPFFEALNRISQGFPAVDREYNKSLGWTFQFSMKSNEMFVFPNKETGFNPAEYDLTNPDNYAAISPNLFRVQKLSSSFYVFSHHLETTISNQSLDLKDITWKRVTSLPNLEGIVKVRINHIGKIVAVGEYD